MRCVPKCIHVWAVATAWSARRSHPEGVADRVASLPDRGAIAAHWLDWVRAANSRVVVQ